MINTSVFDYVNVLDKAADASWTRNKAISNNLANAATPNYKRQDVTFEAELRSAIVGNPGSTDQRIRALNTGNHLSKLNGTVFTDTAAVSYRLDGNNVDVDTENVYLAENQIKYQGLINSINQEFSNFRTVIK
jgi:flagellar basal-body rod protein FlgB